MLHFPILISTDFHFYDTITNPFQKFSEHFHLRRYLLIVVKAETTAKMINISRTKI